jgi:hypothetical protein
MHITVSYDNSPCHKADAIDDIKDWFGPRWDSVSSQMQTVTSVRAFGMLAAISGVQGFPVKAWYDLYHGDGAYDRAWDEIEGEDQ